MVFPVMSSDSKPLELFTPSATPWCTVLLGSTTRSTRMSSRNTTERRSTRNSNPTSPPPTLRRLRRRLRRRHPLSLRAPPPRRRQTPLDDLQQMTVLQRGLHPLLVVELLVDGVLGLVRAGFDADVDPEARWKSTHEPDTKGEACEGTYQHESKHRDWSQPQVQKMLWGDRLEQTRQRRRDIRPMPGARRRSPEDW